MSPSFFVVALLAGLCFCDELEERLENFRKAMSEKSLNGYVVPNSDYHNSEVPMERDKIRQWLTGFTGSNGDAAITQQEAALWTDSRYTIQAKKQLPNSWTLLDTKTKIAKWLPDKISEGQSVGADPRRMPLHLWQSIETKLKEKGAKLVEADDFTKLWQDRPDFPDSPIFIHDLQYNGQNYETKLKRYRKKLEENNCTVGAITSLDEIAWLLNMRGGDAVYTPVFAAFMILKSRDAILYVRSSILTDAVRKHLNSSESPVMIKEYDEFWKDWEKESISDVNVFVPNTANYFVYSSVPAGKRKTGRSLVIDLRAYKTAAEVNASREAHIYDGIALARLFNILEKKIGEEQQPFNESEVSRLATKLRKEASSEYVGPSFADIVASGANGALPHYTIELGNEAPVNSSAVLFIDSGGQYLGGTTDVTRVLHYGQPKPIEIDVYTHLLRGVARLGGTVFPEGTQMKSLDSIMRAPLYEAGLDYGHGSTHGIGVFLSVHEDYNGTYYENFIGSQEPGYYEENNFGMRLENAVVVVPADTKYKGKVNKKFLKFSALTLVPYESKLIDPNVMDESEINWVNNYHKEVMYIVGERLLALQDQDTYNWLVTKTKPILKIPCLNNK